MVIGPPGLLSPPGLSLSSRPVSDSLHGWAARERKWTQPQHLCSSYIGIKGASMFIKSSIVLGTGVRSSIWIFPTLHSLLFLLSLTTAIATVVFIIIFKQRIKPSSGAKSPRPLNSPAGTSPAEPQGRAAVHGTGAAVEGGLRDLLPRGFREPWGSSPGSQDRLPTLGIKTALLWLLFLSSTFSAHGSICKKIWRGWRGRGCTEGSIQADPPRRNLWRNAWGRKCEESKKPQNVSLQRFLGVKDKIRNSAPIPRGHYSWYLLLSSFLISDFLQQKIALSPLPPALLTGRPAGKARSSRVRGDPRAAKAPRSSRTLLQAWRFQGRLPFWLICIWKMWLHQSTTPAKENTYKRRNWPCRGQWRWDSICTGH